MRYSPRQFVAVPPARTWSTPALRRGCLELARARFREILAACAEGLSTAELATRLSLSEGTVRNRMSEILGKLGVRNRAEAVQLARENGWL